MTKVNLSKNEVIHIPGASSAPPDGPFHVLRHTQHGPYRRFCDNADGLRHRRVELVAPVEHWCTACLKRYAKSRGTIYRLGNEPKQGFYIVAAGYEWFQSTIISGMGGPADAPLSASRQLTDDFRSTLINEARRYGFDVAWMPDHQPYPVLLADRPDYYFNWPQLRLLTLEKVATARLADEKKQALDQEAAKIAEKYRQGATFRLW